MADSDRPGETRDPQRISRHATPLEGSAPTRPSGSQELQRISRATGSQEVQRISRATGAQEAQRISRVTGSQEQRASGRQAKIAGSGPINTLATRARRRKILLGIGAGVLVVGAVSLFVMWGAWSDSYEPNPQAAERASAPAAVAGPASPAASATPAPAQAHRRTAVGPAGQAVQAGASGDSATAGAGAMSAADGGTLALVKELDGGLAPAAAGAGTGPGPGAGSAPAAGSVARAQARDGGVAPVVEARRAPALAASKAAEARPRPGPVDAGVAAVSASPDAGRPAPPPRREDSRPSLADDYRGGHVSVDRFAPAAAVGSTMEGRIADFESGRPLPGATVEAIYGEQFIQVESDANGNFEIPGMVPGSHVVVWAGGRRQQWVAERIDVNIPASGKKTDVGVIELLHGDELGSRLEGWIGTYVTGRRGQVKVSAVNAWVPAYKAGIGVGDTILSVDGRDVRGLGSRAVGFLLRGPSGSSITLEVESSDGKRRKMTLERVVR
ncbi:MAG TPA: carboxypeptidase regulatory-like domain-containing protein [Polyangia bacterium]